MKSSRARTITIRSGHLGPETESMDRLFWAAMTPDERVEEAWRLTLEIWEMKGWDPGEPGLRGPVARVVRG
jgi:hypothetical protein